MDPNSPEFKAYQNLLEAHRGLKALIREIDEALGAQTRSIVEVSRLVARLGDQLVKHFAMEEDGGYFADALTHAPQLIARANALLAQHPMMRTQAKTILVDLGSAEGQEHWWEETTQRFRAFKAELLRHEMREDKLLQEAYLQDIGSHD